MIKDFSIIGIVGAAGVVMSKIGLQVPRGFEILHLIGGVSMVAGYVVGLRSKAIFGAADSVVLLTATVVCIISAVLYYIMTSFADPGIGSVLMFSGLNFSIFFSAAFVMGVGQRSLSGQV